MAQPEAYATAVLAELEEQLDQSLFEHLPAILAAEGVGEPVREHSGSSELRASTTEALAASELQLDELHVVLLSQTADPPLIAEGVPAKAALPSSAERAAVRGGMRRECITEPEPEPEPQDLAETGGDSEQRERMIRELEALEQQLDQARSQLAQRAEDPRSGSEVTTERLAQDRARELEAELAALRRDTRLEAADAARAAALAVAQAQAEAEAQAEVAAEKGSALALLSSGVRSTEQAAAEAMDKLRAETMVRQQEAQTRIRELEAEVAALRIDRARSEAADAPEHRLTATHSAQEETYRLQLQVAEDRATALEAELSDLTTHAEKLRSEVYESQRSFEAQRQEMMALSSQLTSGEVRADGHLSPASHCRGLIISPGSSSPQLYSPTSPLSRELSEGSKRNTMLLEKLKRDRLKREQQREKERKLTRYRRELAHSLSLQPEEPARGSSGGGLSAWSTL